MRKYKRRYEKSRSEEKVKIMIAITTLMCLQFNWKFKGYEKQKETKFAIVILIYCQMCLIQTLWGSVKMFELGKSRIMRVRIRQS